MSNVMDSIPKPIKAVADAGSWATAVIGVFTDWSPVIAGVAGVLAIIWTALQIYDWVRKKVKKMRTS